MDIVTVRHRRKRSAKAVEQFACDTRWHIAPRGFGIRRFRKARPAPPEPVGSIGFIICGAGKFLLKRLDKAHRVFVRPIGINYAFGLKTFGI